MMSRAGWVATASHVSDHADEIPSAALDGDASTRWGSGIGQTEGMWFQLDMGFPREFDQIILDAAGSGNDYPRAYEVYVTDDTSSLGDVLASGAGTDVTVIDLPEKVTGQYIRIVSGESNGQWWSIHEIDVPCVGSEINTISPHPAAKSAFTVDIRAENKGVVINYRLPEQGQVTIEEYSLSGSLLGTLVDDFKNAGDHVFKRTVKHGSSKTILYKIRFNGHTQLKMVTLLN
jgi:hypothetical protein